MAITLPPDSIVAAIHGSVTRVTRRVDIYESDRATPWTLDVPISAGSVDIDQSRNERRTVDLALDNTERLLTASPDGLWYDKIIKVFRGVETSSESWETQIGEFRIDSISSPHFPALTSIRGRDHTKALLGSKFAFNTLYPENHPIEEVVRDVAFAGGIPLDQMDLPLTGESLSREYIFETEGQRWAAIKEVSNAYNYEVFFTPDGMLTMRQHQDPTTLPESYTFETGPETGNLAKFDKDATDTFLKNHIVAVGENASQIPVWAEAENTTLDHPTSIDRIGRRTDFFKTSFIETQVQAQEVADRMLKVSALEQYNLSLESIVVPYIDVGIVVKFVDPNPDPNDPTKYLMQRVNIPLGLGAMTGNAGRVINIGVS